MIVFLDTNIVIYAVENPPVFGAKALARMGALRTAGDLFMISDLTRMECLVGPLAAGDKSLVNQYRAFFAAIGIQLVPITGAVCDRAALIRAQFRFKALDALHLAAAIEHGASHFLTNDNRLSTFTGIPIEALS